MAVALLLAAPAQAAEPVDWQLTIAKLAAERTLAHNCVSVFKQVVDDPGARASGQLTYGQAKAEMDALITQLQVALIEGMSLANVDVLEGRMGDALAKRDQVCDLAIAAVPPDDRTTKSVEAIVGAVIEGTIGAVVDLIIHRDTLDEARRENLRLELDDQIWPAFGAVDS